MYTISFQRNRAVFPRRNYILPFSEFLHLLSILCKILCTIPHSRRLWGQPGHAPPIIKLGGQNPFLPIIRGELLKNRILPPIIRDKEIKIQILKKAVDD